MKKDHGVNWRRLGWIEKLFLGLVAIWALLYFAGAAGSYQTIVALAVIFLGVVIVIRIGRMALRNAIWRLRNRLIVAYLFIAVVPIVLIFAVLGGRGYWVVGQTAVPLVYTERKNPLGVLGSPADTIVRAPA